MTSKVKSVPQGYHTLTPYLIIKGAARAIEFYKKAFGATEVLRMSKQDGSIGHAEMMVGDSRMMLADECPEMGARSPQSFAGTPVMMHLYVEDVDGMTKQALAAGAKEMKPVQDQFYGDRSGLIADPFGHVWSIATHIEDVSAEELHKRFESMMKQQAHS